MGKIIKNGVTYSGSSDNADSVKYNNNVSNLDATNVQEAIDKLDESVDTLNSNLGGMSFYEDENGNKYVVGADSVPKKLGECDFKITIRAAYDNTDSDGLYDKAFTYKNGNWTSSDIQKDNGSGAAQGWSYMSVISFEFI